MMGPGEQGPKPWMSGKSWRRAELGAGVPVDGVRLQTESSMGMRKGKETTGWAQGGWTVGLCTLRPRTEPNHMNLKKFLNPGFTRTSCPGYFKQPRPPQEEPTGRQP